MDPKSEKRLEKRYKAHIARKRDILTARVILIFFVSIGLAVMSFEYLPSPYGASVFLSVFVASLLFVFYFLREPIETEIFAELYNTYERIGFYSEDEARSHLLAAESHLSDAVNKMGKLLSGKRRSLLYKKEADEPLKELRNGIRKRIIPSISREINLTQIREKVGRLALIFIESPPRFIKIREYNRGLKAIREIPQKNLRIVILDIWRWIKEPILAFSFSIFLVMGINAIVHPTGFAYVQEKIAEIVGASVGFTAIILAGKRIAIKKRVPVKE